jgi:hypothetical protein
MRGLACLGSVQDLYHDCMKDEPDEPEVRARIDLIMDEAAWFADQRAKIAKDKRKLRAAG